jgi:putative DNA primase/helicase
MYSVEERSMNGSAIRLHKVNEGDAIVIGEGIETTLSASILTGLPGWASMDAGKMELIEIPEMIKMIVIAGDNDESFTGQAAAYNLAKRLKLKGKIVEVIIPEKIGDFNDKLLDK